MDSVIHRFKSSKTREVRITNLIHKDKNYVDIRFYARPQAGRRFMPTGKGLIVDANFLPEMVWGFEKALEQIVQAMPVSCAAREEKP